MHDKINDLMSNKKPMMKSISAIILIETVKSNGKSDLILGIAEICVTIKMID